MPSSSDPDGRLHPRTRPWSRITPRTCLWPLVGSLLGTFGLSLGLTFRSNHYCYAGTCGEWLFPLQARLHIVVWYVWLSTTVTFLAIRAFHPQMQKVLAKPVIPLKVPLMNRKPTNGATLMLLWIVTLYAVIVGIWWLRLQTYFADRTASAGIKTIGDELAAIALTGHFCDVTMGLALVPISRHSALASFFQLSASTTLTLHMLSAYTLFVLVLIHALLYVSWIALMNNVASEAKRMLPILNPTYLYHETWPGNTTPLGIWRASLPFTGFVAVLIMLIVFFTTLPVIRRKHFNLFYFTHLSTILMVIVICLHASTMLYCTAPGLAMWCLDWSMRLHELKSLFPGKITSLGKGWYCITAPVPRSRLAGCSCRSPLAHFFIHHGDSSKREVHPFSTITHLATADATTPADTDEITIQFLFRKAASTTVQEKPELPKPWLPYLRPSRGTKAVKSMEWTEKLADSVDRKGNEPDGDGAERQDPQVKSSTNVSLRLEGPYFSPADPSRYNTVVCLVAGTGISGAIAVAGGFNAVTRSRVRVGSISSNTTRTSSPWSKCVIAWSVREQDYIDPPCLDVCHGLELRTCLTGPGRPRQDVKKIMDEVQEAAGPGGKIWVYISGPKGFIENAKTVCKTMLRVDYYAASWDI